MRSWEPNCNFAKKTTTMGLTRIFEKQTADETVVPSVFLIHIFVIKEATEVIIFGSKSHYRLDISISPRFTVPVELELNITATSNCSRYF